MYYRLNVINRDIPLLSTQIYNKKSLVTKKAIHGTHTKVMEKFLLVIPWAKELKKYELSLTFQYVHIIVPQIVAYVVHDQGISYLLTPVSSEYHYICYDSYLESIWTCHLFHTCYCFYKTIINYFKENSWCKLYLPQDGMYDCTATYGLDIELKVMWLEGVCEDAFSL